MSITPVRALGRFPRCLPPWSAFPLAICSVSLT